MNGRFSILSIGAGIVLTFSAVSFAQDSQPKSNTPASPTSGTQNVNVVNMPTVTVGNTVAVQAQPATVTHMGQRPSNQVVLSNFGAPTCATWVRVASNGSLSAFTIPAGQNLVITDMDFSAFSTGVSPGTFNALELDLGSGSVPVLQTFVLADPAGTLATSQHLTSGVVVSILPACSGGANANTIRQVVIRGYLIPAS